MIKNYFEYKENLILENLILESKIEFSKSFTILLNSMRANKIASELLKLKSNVTDAGFIQNYIDLSKEKDMVTFVPDRKAIELLGKEIPRWVTTSSSCDKYFTINKNEEGEYKNKHIFDALGFSPPTEERYWCPESNIVGDIKAETISSISGKTAVWFVTDDGRQSIINKESLVPFNDTYNKLWTTHRNNIKVGRLAKSILDVAGISATSSEIEEFVNKYKSTFDIINDAFSKLELVNGNLISYWYSDRNYHSSRSTLGNSCMASVDKRFFDLYTKNPSVCSLLILYSDDGEIIDGKYKSDKIKGRALVWKTDCGDTFMDRIYTNYDNDTSLFQQYAEKEGWWFKVNQNSDRTFICSNGKSTKNPTYVVSVDNCDFGDCYYPYVDTLAYLYTDNNKISNKKSYDDVHRCSFVMDNTNGYRQEQ